MAYTETRSTSWFDRMGSSFRGIGVGLILIVVGTILLWWNEGNFVATGDALTEAQGVTQELGDISKIDSAKNGQLVHATGPAETDDLIKDPIFGIEVNAIRLERKVEFYQWIEESKTEKRKKLGGGEEEVTVYTYKQQWVPNPVDSADFKDPAARRQHRNVVAANVENFSIQATNVTFGAYHLPEGMISSIGGAAPMDILFTEEQLNELNERMLSSLAAAWTPEELDTLGVIRQGITDGVNEALTGAPAQPLPTTSEREADKLREQRQYMPKESSQVVHVSGNTIYIGLAPGVPRAGDVRLTFTEVKPATISILAKVNGGSFEPYRAKNGKVVSKLSMGTHSVEDMYGAAHSSNSMMTWMLRFLGTFLVFFGLRMVVAPLEVMASVIPILGSVVGAGTGLVAALLGLAWSLIIISIAWLRFRPVIGVIMLAFAGGLLALLFIKGRSRKATQA